MNFPSMLKKKKFNHELNEQQILKCQKLTYLMLQQNIESYQRQQQFLLDMSKQVDEQCYQYQQLIQKLERQIQQAQQVNQNLTHQFQSLLNNSINDTIAQQLRTIQSNKQNLEQIQNKIQEKKRAQIIIKQQVIEKKHILNQDISRFNSLRYASNCLRQQISCLQKNQSRRNKMMKQNDQQLQEMFILKKKYNNQLQQVKGQIRVYCRIRPPNSQKTVIKVTSQNSLKLKLTRKSHYDQHQEYEQNFLFEHVFNEMQTQSQVFDQIAQLVQNSIDGKNVCIFAYGQTGSGKTFTLLGPSQQGKLQQYERLQMQGLTPRSLQLIFKEIKPNNTFKMKYKLFLSIQEIYMETIIDLIAKNTTTMDNIKQVQVQSIEEVLAYLKESIQARKTAQTSCNQRSSRSHLILTLRIQGKSQNSTSQTKNGSLTFIDLAGSQRLKQSKVEGQVMKQSMSINKSLSALGNVINGIRKNSQHIPYRNSKLTHLLQKYLQGDSKTLMFVNVSPDQSDSFQSKISLAFAQSVRQCKLNKK